MMKATCQWSDRNTTSFRWTRHELITPPSAHKELSRAAVKGIGEMRCSPLFSVQTVEGVNVYVYTSVDFVDSEPKTFAVAFGWYGPIDWANTEAAVWIEAANGAIKLEMINAGTADKETFWHVRRWLENKFGEKSYVWESVVKFFDGVLWTPFEWQGSRDSLLRFSAASDVFFGFELTRFEKQPAIVEWQPEIVQPAAMQQNGVNEENEEVADELNTSDYLVPGMNAGGDHGEQLAATPRRAPSMSSAATSFTNLTLLDHE
ncbi:hypothetical protein M3Y99_00692400 [Aphelenchoides fujianensis]|nr:hypothetical protein M3Y99_00692400 [Aphelenchoides fujianensis]